MEQDLSGASGSAGDFSIGSDPGNLSSETIQAGTTNNFGTGFADDAQATIDPSNVLSQASFNQAMGITSRNPYGNAGFFTSFFGIPADMLDYTGLGIDTQGIANLAYDRYMNPFGDLKGAKTEEDLSLREGLSPGEKTRFGQVVSIDRPQGITETLARTAFGLASPLGPLTSFMGKEQLALAPDPRLNSSRGFNYDPTLDPNSPEYQGPQGFLGQLGKGIESITFGGARPVTESAKGIMSLLESQDAKRAMGGYETFDGQKM